MQNTVTISARSLRESSCAKFRVLAAAAARERRPEFVGRGPGLNQAGPGLTARLAAGQGSLRRSRWAGRWCWWRRSRHPGGQGGPSRCGSATSGATRGRAGRTKAVSAGGGSVGGGCAEWVWRWRRVGVVACAEGVPWRGGGEWRQVAVSGHDRGRLGGRGELDLLRYRRS
jgi:hypothetical protein